MPGVWCSREEPAELPPAAQGEGLRLARGESRATPDILLAPLGEAHAVSGLFPGCVPSCLDMSSQQKEQVSIKVEFASSSLYDVGMVLEIPSWMPRTMEQYSGYVCVGEGSGQKLCWSELIATCLHIVQAFFAHSLVLCGLHPFLLHCRSLLFAHVHC